MTRAAPLVLAVVLVSLAARPMIGQGGRQAGQESRQQPPADPESTYRFKSGVDLINVTATVSDASGRFVTGLTQEDFIVFEDDQPQSITHFSADRVPVSLGIVLDTSGSMAGDKIRDAQAALASFLGDLDDPEDEFFLYRFSDKPILMEEWTRDRGVLSRALRRVIPSGGTAMYDAVSDAIPMAERGQNRKKAVVVISDGNDTSSIGGAFEVNRRVRRSEVLVYAIGIDGDSEPTFTPPQRRPPIQFPPPGGNGPFPPGRRPAPWPPTRPPIGIPGSLQQGGLYRGRPDQRVNVRALREITDDSGGRTEVIREARDLEPATANIADELTQQYYIGYPAAAKKDGRWHTIRVEMKNGTYRVRARRGYTAS
jgi:VWFA-related protein